MLHETKIFQKSGYTIRASLNIINSPPQQPSRPGRERPRAFLRQSEEQTRQTRPKNKTIELRSNFRKKAKCKVMEKIKIFINDQRFATIRKRQSVIYEYEKWSEIK